MKILRIILASIVILTVTEAKAQSWVDKLKTTQKLDNVGDPKAKKILDKVSAKYKSYKSMAASFKLKIESTAKKISEEQSGKVTLSGNKYKIEMKSQDIICDGKNIWTYLKESKEVQVNTYEPNSKTITPSEIFTLYEKGFLYTYSNEETDKSGVTFDVIEFTPLDKNKPFFKIKLHIDRAKNQIKKAQIFEKNGNRYIYTMSTFETNTINTDTYFAWDAKANPGVTVVDLR